MQISDAPVKQLNSDPDQSREENGWFLAKAIGTGFRAGSLLLVPGAFVFYFIQ